MWRNIEPPFRSIYKIREFSNCSRNSIQFFFYSMCMMESALLVLKIFSPNFKPLNWAIAFSPAYYVLGAYPCFPSGPLKDYIWCMLLSVLALVTIKLSPNESTVKGSVNWLVIVFVPLFCAQGYVFMCHYHYGGFILEPGPIWLQSCIHAQIASESSHYLDVVKLGIPVI